MLEYNEILPKRVILLDGEPYEVLDAHVFRKQQRKPVNQTKLRHLITGKVTEQSFHVSEKVEEADLSTKEVKYLYADNKGLKWFCATDNPSDRFSLSDDVIGAQGQFMKANSILEANIFDEKIIGIKMPIKVDLVVKEAPPAVKGDTARGGSKEIVLETGARVQAPLFINEGDVVRINTQEGIYTERVDKK